MYVTKAWYWAAWSNELTDKPVYRRLMNEDVALYRGNDGHVHGLAAMCPHRGANLAKGKIEGNCIRCPFHGLKFDAKGQCVEIPSQPPSEPISSRAKVAVYTISEKDGVVWFWPNQETPPTEEPPDSFWLNPDNHEYFVRRSARRQDSDFVITTETAIEDSHVSFVHPKSLKITTPRVPKYLIEEHKDGRGFTAKYDPESPWWVDTDVTLTKSVKDYSDFRRRAEYDVVWRLGSQLTIHIRDPSGYELRASAFVTPSEIGSVWFALGAATSNRSIKEKIINLVSRIFPVGLGGGQVTDEDERATAEWILCDRQGGLEKPVFTQSDAVCVAFRRIYERHARDERKS